MEGGGGGGGGVLAERERESEIGKKRYYVPFSQFQSRSCPVIWD